MVLLVRHRYTHYKRYMLDIWGVVRLGTLDLDKRVNVLGVERSIAQLATDWTMNHRIAVWIDQGSRRKTRLLLFFYNLWERRRRNRFQRSRKYIYRVEIHGPPKFRRYRKPTFLSVRLVRLFYLTYNFRQLRRVILGAQGKVGFYEENLAYALESRLMCFLYRTGFVSSLFSSIDFIRAEAILVNHDFVTFIHHKIVLGDLVHIDDYGRAIIYVRLVKRLRKKAAFFPYAPFLFVSFKLLCAYYKRPPKVRELVFPIRLDLHAVVNYFGGRK